MFVLIHLPKDGEPREYRVEKLPTRLGRVVRDGIRIEDPSISREHARFFERDGVLQVADLNSSNGTFVNGKRVTLAPIRDGDEIRLGAVRFKVRMAIALKGMPDPPAVQAAEPETSPAKARKAPHKPKAPPKPAVPEGAGAIPEARTVRVTPSGAAEAASSSKDGIRVKQDLLQFHRIDARKERSFLRNDFAQYGGLTRLVILIALLAMVVGGFYLFRWVGQTITPKDLDDAGGVHAVEEPGTEEVIPEDDF